MVRDSDSMTLSLSDICWQTVLDAVYVSRGLGSEDLVLSGNKISLSLMKFGKSSTSLYSIGVDERLRIGIITLG